MQAYSLSLSSQLSLVQIYSPADLLHLIRFCWCILVASQMAVDSLYSNCSRRAVGDDFLNYFGEADLKNYEFQLVAGSSWSLSFCFVGAFFIIYVYFSIILVFSSV